MELATLALIPLLNYKQPNITPQPTYPTAIVETAKPEPKTYTIVDSDTLTKIAEAQGVSVDRLWAKNLNIQHQDVLIVGEKLTIPTMDEKLAPRAFLDSATVNSAIGAQTGSVQAQNGSNTYEPGQCVWYVKNMRPELPNTWGSASTWLSRAIGQGWPTGSTPRVGAVGWTSGHVVLITGVSGNTVSYTDMNGRWIPFEINNGTAEASKYVYIY